MQGDIVSAAKWLGGAIVLAGVVCVVGLHPAVTGRTIRIEPMPAADAPRPVQPTRPESEPPARDYYPSTPASYRR